MPHDAERVTRIVEKAEFIEECLSILVSKQSVSRTQYRQDAELRDIVERRFEKVTQATIDIGRMLLKERSESTPEANAAVMVALDDAGVLTTETAAQMAQAATFGNVLAHEYGDVLDNDIVYDALQNLDRYRAFLHEVRDYLAECGAL